MQFVRNQKDRVSKLRHTAPTNCSTTRTTTTMLFGNLTIFIPTLWGLAPSHTHSHAQPDKAKSYASIKNLSPQISSSFRGFTKLSFACSPRRVSSGQKQAAKARALVPWRTRAHTELRGRGNRSQMATPPNALIHF